MRVFQDGLLTGKTAFLTGGTSGIGLGMAKRFGEMGARVYVVGRDAAKLEAACAAIPGEAAGAAADVRDYAALAAAFAACRERFGVIDILVCGAAGNFPAPVTGISPNGFKAVMDIDLLGTFHACRAAYEHLRKPGASVISISANHASVPYPMQAHVCAAKAGVERLTQVIALEWASDGIRANCINPGPIEDTEGMRRLAPTEELRAAVRATVPLGRFGTQREIADLALFLASDAAAYITGAVLHCDGGQALNGAAAFRMP